MYDFSSESNILFGDIGNIILLVSTIAITFCWYFVLPSPDYYDSNWVKNGFCVANIDSSWMNSHKLAFYADSFLGSIILYLYCTQPKSAPQLQKSMLFGGIFGVLCHGFGHLHLSAEPGGMDMRFRPNEDMTEMIINQLVTIIVYGGIFFGTMPFASTFRLIMTSAAATLGLTFLNVPPTHNFVYGQASIYIATAIHMLTLSPENKSTAVYVLYPYLQLPVLLIGVLESTACESLLVPIGGHMIFDSSVALGLIFMVALSRPMEAKRTHASKKIT